MKRILISLVIFLLLGCDVPKPDEEVDNSKVVTMYIVDKVINNGDYVFNYSGACKTGTTPAYIYIRATSVNPVMIDSIDFELVQGNSKSFAFQWLRVYNNYECTGSYTSHSVPYNTDTLMTNQKCIKIQINSGFDYAGKYFLTTISNGSISPYRALFQNTCY
jgi:hypothetical protein